MSRVWPALAVAAAMLFAGAAIAQTPPAQVQTGTIRAVNGTTMVLETRTGALATVDASAALRLRRSVPLQPGETVSAIGTRDPAGLLHADAISRAKPAPALWPPDQ